MNEAALRKGLMATTALSALAGGIITFTSSGDGVQAVGGIVILLASLIGLWLSEQISIANDRSIAEIQNNVEEVTPEVWMRWDVTTVDPHQVVCTIYEPRNLFLGHVALELIFNSQVVEQSVVVETRGPAGAAVHGAWRELNDNCLRIEGELGSQQTWLVSARTVTFATEPELRVFSHNK